ncbi:MAG: hypothetical protein EOM72_04275 [Opitutae bacterium]|nr:hypothetical protein [Opitutae bacterium]
MDRLLNFGRAHVRSLAAGSAVLLATVLAVLFYSATWRTGDDGRYYVLGVSIAEGAGLVHYENPLQPPESLTPPLYPALIAGVMRTTDNPVVWVKRTGNALYVLAVLMAVLALMGPRGVSRPGLMGAYMGMLAVGVASFASFIMSDTLFILWVYACLWLSGREKQGWLACVVLGCGCGLAYLTRIAGLALVPALLLPVLLKRQWRNLLFIGLGLGVVVAPWFYRKYFLLDLPDHYVAMAEGYARMQGQKLWVQFPLIMAQEFIRDIPVFLAKVIPRQFLYAATEVIPSQLFWDGVGGVAGFAMAAGLLLRIRRWTAIDYFFIFTILLIAAIPGPIYDKYAFFPILPIAAFYCFGFMEWVAHRAAGFFHSKWMGHGVRAAALGALVFSLLLDFTAGGIHFAKETPRRLHGPWAPERFQSFGNAYYDAWARVSEAATWIRKNTPADALLMSRKPDHLFVMSGRQGWRYDLPRKVLCETSMDAVEKFSPDRMVLLLEDAFPSGPTFDAYGNNREAVLNETVRKMPERWRVVYSTAEPVTRVWAYGGGVASATGE